MCPTTDRDIPTFDSAPARNKNTHSYWMTCPVCWGPAAMMWSSPWTGGRVWPNRNPATSVALMRTHGDLSACFPPVRGGVCGSKRM